MQTQVKRAGLWFALGGLLLVAFFAFLPACRHGCPYLGGFLGLAAAAVAGGVLVLLGRAGDVALTDEGISIDARKLVPWDAIATLAWCDSRRPTLVAHVRSTAALTAPRHGRIYLDPQRLGVTPDQLVSTLRHLAAPRELLLLEKPVRCGRR